MTVRRGAYLYLERSQILFSYAKSYGGAVYSNYATVVANATRFENCSAATDSGRGGALAVFYGNLTLESTRWSGVAPPARHPTTRYYATMLPCHAIIPTSLPSSPYCRRHLTTNHLTTNHATPPLHVISLVGNEAFYGGAMFVYSGDEKALNGTRAYLAISVG